MYSTHARKFVSHLTKREYGFDPTGKHGPASKSKAKAQMEADHREIELAFEQRLGRKPTARELLHGVKEPDTRSVRERVAEEAVHAPKPEAPADVFANRLAELSKSLRYARTSKDRNMIQRKIDALTEASNKAAEKRAETAAFEQYMQSIPVQKAIEHARNILSLLLANDQASESEIAEARNRLKALEQTGNVESYQSALEAAEQAEKQNLRGREAEYHERLKALRAEMGMDDGEIGIGEATNNTLPVDAIHVSGDAPIDE